MVSVDVEQTVSKNGRKCDASMDESPEAVLNGCFFGGSDAAPLRPTRTVDCCPTDGQQPTGEKPAPALYLDSSPS